MRHSATCDAASTLQHCSLMLELPAAAARQLGQALQSSYHCCGLLCVSCTPLVMPQQLPGHQEAFVPRPTEIHSNTASDCEGSCGGSALCPMPDIQDHC
jgi:hypothetical protein